METDKNKDIVIMTSTTKEYVYLIFRSDTLISIDSIEAERNVLQFSHKEVSTITIWCWIV